MRTYCCMYGEIKVDLFIAGFSSSYFQLLLCDLLIRLTFIPKICYSGHSLASLKCKESWVLVIGTKLQKLKNGLAHNICCWHNMSYLIFFCTYLLPV